MTTTTVHRSPVISLAAERARRGEPELFPPLPQLNERQSARALIQLHEMQPPQRLRRGVSKLSLACAGLWLISGLALAGALVVIMAGLLWGLGSLTAMWSGQ